jgi:hypothetical protein
MTGGGASASKRRLLFADRPGMRILNLTPIRLRGNDEMGPEGMTITIFPHTYVELYLAGPVGSVRGGQALLLERCIPSPHASRVKKDSTPVKISNIPSVDVLKADNVVFTEVAS